MRIFSKISLLGILFAIVITLVAFWYINSRVSPLDLPNTPNPVGNQTPTPPPSPNDPQPPAIIPNSLLLKVPFTSQAPTANWDELHNEACEEASSIMAHAYFSGSTEATLTPTYVEAELAKITDWETKTFGYYLDIDTEETAKLLRDYYGLHTSIIQNPSEQDIKQALTLNKLVLWPANGQMLGNPNFRQPGPPYHMLVIRGFTSTNIITNDPGTRKGLNYPYTFSVLQNANGTWDHSTSSVNTNNKMAIVVSQ